MRIKPFHTVSETHLAEALLRYQFFPNVKPSHEELPPIFSSDSFTESVAEQLSRFGTGGRSHADYVHFRSRKFNGLVRQMGLPHPVTHARLVLHLRDNWQDLVTFLTGPESMIKPHRRGKDSRVIVMDYGSPESRAVRATKSAQSMRYVLHADISNCFPSLYSHSIDWALRGFGKAKASKGGSAWEAKLDEYTRNCHDKETKGLMIGPAVSNVVSELVLQQIDNTLRSKGHEFVRYIDDYTAFFRSRDEAEEFVAHLDRSLSQYRLVLNSRKTRVVSLREGFGEPWINDIQSHVPKRSGTVAAIRFLQHCELLAHSYPEQSVMLYAVKTLLSRRKCPRLQSKRGGRRPNRSDLAILDELVRLNYFHPHLSCFVARQLWFSLPRLSRSEKDRLAIALRRQLAEASVRAESDTIIWLVFCLRRLLKRRIPTREIDALLALDDDLVWIAIATMSKIGRQRVVDRVKAINSNDRSACEQHWLSRYELFRVKEVKATSLDKSLEAPWFTEARKLRLSFTDLV